MLGPRLIITIADSTHRHGYLEALASFGTFHVVHYNLQSARATIKGRKLDHMPLILAIRNNNAIVVACDSSDTDPSPAYGECMVLPNHVVILVAGNLPAVKGPLTQLLPQLKAQPGAAEVAQLIHAQLNLMIVPDLDQLKGRIEIIVAGFGDHHRQAVPALFYMDSAQTFAFQNVDHHSVAGGASAALTGLLDSKHDFSDASTDQLQVLAKECISATKLKWPMAVLPHIKIGVVTPVGTRIQIF